jgi:NAD(P)-dependent dehydrogenase (short-subunit alcohol dehydrogenase family)
MKLEDLKGAVGVVTGAGAGLGAALAHRLSAAGMRVAVADIAIDNAERVAAGIREQGGEALPIAVDIGDETAIESMAGQVESELGPCQILCSNVGVQQFGKAEDLHRADWEWVYGVNVFGTVATTRIFLPQMRRAGGDRRILLTASTSALYPGSHMSAYVSSKYAVLGYAETLRLELAAEGIGVTALLPGPMSTTHLLSSKAAKPETNGAPVFTPETIEVVASEAGGEMIDPMHATRNVLDDLAANRPYCITHFVHDEVIFARFKEIEEAFERAKR